MGGFIVVYARKPHPYNLSEFRARGGRGRPATAPRDLIPPSLGTLCQSKARKPTVSVGLSGRGGRRRWHGAVCLGGRGRRRGGGRARGRGGAASRAVAAAQGGGFAGAGAGARHGRDGGLFRRGGQTGGLGLPRAAGGFAGRGAGNQGGGAPGGRGASLGRGRRGKNGRGGEARARAFAREPRLLAPHRLVQAESVAVAADGAALFVVSEGRGSPVVCYRRGAAG